MAGNGGNLNKPGAEKINMDNLWIYGYSIANLQRFYAPQYDAMKHLNKKNLYGNKYPVSKFFYFFLKKIDLKKKKKIVINIFCCYLFFFFFLFFVFLYF